MAAQQPWYVISNEDQVDTPMLVFYMDRIKQNIQLLKDMVPDTAMLRPHVKTHKSREISLMLMAEGIHKFKCSTLAEAEMLGSCGAKDVLLAYQLTKVKVEKWIAQIKSYPDTKFSVLVDHLDICEYLSLQAKKFGLTFNIYIDLNVGMDRTGISPDYAFALFQSIVKLPGLKFEGFHAYDGHRRELIFEERVVQCEREFMPVEKLRRRIADLGYPFPLLIAGGSPTFAIHAKRANVEVSPGTFIFWDYGYSVNIPEQKFLCAALVLTRIVSLPAKDKVCLDLGYKAIASENEMNSRVVFLNGATMTTHSHSEEHMVVNITESARVKIGDLIYALPYHICPTVAMYNKVGVIINCRVVKFWAITARS